MPLRKVSRPNCTETCQVPAWRGAIAAAGTAGLPSLLDRLAEPLAAWSRPTSIARAASASSASTCGSSAAATSERIWSLHCSSSVLSSGFSAIWPSRSRSSKVSTWWVKPTTASRPKIPADPLTVWAQRNSASSSSRSLGASSSCSISCSIVSTCSRASLMKAGSASAMKSCSLGFTLEPRWPCRWRARLADPGSGRRCAVARWVRPAAAGEASRPAPARPAAARRPHRPGRPRRH